MKLKQKIYILFATISIFTGTMVSCIKSEDPNAEADIITCSVHPEGLLIREPTINNTDILLIVKRGTDLTSISLNFTLTEGATIDPPNGTTRDFTTPQTYKVTSEDGKWSKSYIISASDADMNTTYHFEDTIGGKKYYILAERDEKGKEITTWTSGNAGFSMTNSKLTAEEFPTTQSPNGFKGKCAKLETKNTGTFGKDNDMPIAAGNLFLGSFNTVTAVSKPLEATRFGLPFDKYPTRLTGYYKYKRGKDFLVFDKDTKEQKLDPTKKDICDIYAVFYETDETLISLDGTNSLIHPNIVAIARIKDAKETNSWTFFDLDFEYTKNPNHQKVIAGEYNLSIVFTSSIDGHLFSGALGSTLYIDEVSIKYIENID